MRFFGLKNCDTCRKALASIRADGGQPVVIDVRSDGVAKADLKRFVAAFGDAIVNRRSTTWRGLSDAERAGDALALLKAHPTLMKRPVIENDDGALSLGWPRN